MENFHLFKFFKFRSAWELGLIENYQTMKSIGLGSKNLITGSVKEIGAHNFVLEKRYLEIQMHATLARTQAQVIEIADSFS